MAQKLNITLKAVGWTLGKLRKKTGIENRTLLAIWWFQNRPKDQAEIEIEIERNGNRHP